MLRLAILSVVLVLAGAPAAAAQPEGTLIVRVTSGGQPVQQAEVRVGTVTALTNADGEAVLKLPAGPFAATVSRFGYEQAVVQGTVAPAPSRAHVELKAESVVSEDVIVTATRTTQRVQDLPLRVEVVPQEEIDEKVFMTPGDISMMLTETNGLRVQVTSPSLGAASVRIQGLRGRYTQILADGLPLYGPAGSIGILHIPPMDLAQVEVIKGVASALYGASALGGIINLVSRRPQQDPEREILINRTSRGGTDAVVWLSRRSGSRWGYTFLGGGHAQERTDIDRDGWTDLPGYRRAHGRPRLFWEDGKGRSLFVTAGALVEDREGGTIDGAVAPDGAPFREDLTTRRFDGGMVGRFVMSNTRVVTIRASAFGQWHERQFGESQERDVHHTLFVETAVNGQRGRHTWVLGAALQRDLHRTREFPAFDYAYVVPGVFAQDDFAPARWLTLSASGRVDVHDEFGTFFSPRVSALVKAAANWRMRLSGGTGFYAPTPFTEETEATGLSRLSPLGRLEAERGRSVSLDVSWKREPMEVTGTIFGSTVRNPVSLRESDPATGGSPVEIVNAAGSARTSGSELIARFHRGEMDLIATYMYVWATEPDPSTAIRRETTFNPRHTAGIDWLVEVREGVRVGVELFYTGRQQLDDSPYRRVSPPYWMYGVVAEWRVGKVRLFVNSENLADVRQTRHEPLVRPTRAPDGLWTVDAWGPLEGRIFNAGARLRF